MVAMKHIAEKCGVSIATVSKALNGRPDISDEMREKILSVANETGYMTNSAARALKTNRTFNLGVLFADEGSRGLTHEYFAAVLNSFKTEAERCGYDITFISTKAKIDRRSSTCLQHCLYRGVDGLLIACTDFNDSQVSELIASSLPVVTIDHVFNGKPSVLSDNVAGEEALCGYACSQGHRKIAIIKGEADSAVTISRLKGFFRACEAEGIDVPDSYVLQGQYYEPDVAYGMTKQLLEMDDRPTCILYPDDFSLTGGVRAIIEAGLKVPDDISIAGYDGIIVSQVMTPQMTTYSQDTEGLGRTAAKKLIELIEHPKTTLTDTEYVSGHLIKGGSIGPVRS